MKEFKILYKEETNEFANPLKATDGGGYSQPYIVFEYDGKRGSFYNSSCGGFGPRYYINFGEKHFHLDFVYTNRYLDSNFTELDQEFINDFAEEFGVNIWTSAMVEEKEEDL